MLRTKMLKKGIRQFLLPSCTGCNRAFISSTSLFPETISLIRTAEGSDVYLVGTAHVSRRSAEEVGDLIRLVKPDMVFLELCPARAAKLRAGQTGTDEFLKSGFKKIMANPSASQALTGLPTPLQAMVKMGALGGNGPNDFLLGMLRQFFDRFYNAFRSYGLIPGLEFKVAMEEAEKIGAALEFGDRSGTETLSLLLQALKQTDLMGCLTKPVPPHLQEPFVGGVGGLEEMVEKMKNREQIAAMRDYMELTMPNMMDALVHSRDQIMVDNLVHYCQQSQPASVVAVVGMAHMDGIEARFLGKGASIQAPS